MISLGADYQRWFAAAAVMLIYVGLCAWVWRRHRSPQPAVVDVSITTAENGDVPEWRITYASQTGSAHVLAEHTQALLREAGDSTEILELDALTPARMNARRGLLLIVSTYGEGDPPDNAARFAREVMSTPQDLKTVKYALLALGDATYARVCGFGRMLDDWMQGQGAQALHPRIEVDRGDAAALARWDAQLVNRGGDETGKPVAREIKRAQTPAFQDWQLVARHCLNPGSSGSPTYHLEFQPAADSLPVWQAGDLARIQGPTAPHTVRDYSIASLPREGALVLLIRQQRRADGSLGEISGWLTAGLPLGGLLRLQLRAHARFRVGSNAHRPLILIGNGTGMAGLRAHIAARAQAGEAPVWLIFGERQMQCDFYYRETLEQWQAQQVLTHLDTAFSRDPGEPRYVQACLYAAASRLQAWVAQGAAIYVCGSLRGMAEGVDKALDELLGAAALATLRSEGRYRRDVY